MPKFGLELEDVERDERRLLRRLSQNAEDLTYILEDISRDIDKLEYEKTAYKIAFMNALEFIENYALDTIINAAKIGCIQSNEFNYFPYINHLEDAIRNNREGLVEIIPLPDEDDVEINIDFTPLGHVDMWAEAVQAVRERLQELGLSKRGYISEPIAASRMWREKIYKTGREGGKVFRTRKKKNKEGGEEEEKVDVTAQYKDKYKRTILARLEELPRGKAPYWYLIEHGNVNMTPNRGGEPYPTFGGTNFTKLAKDKLRDLWYDAFWKYRDKAEEFLSDSLARDYGFAGGSTSFDELEEDIITQILEGVDKTIVSTAKAGSRVGQTVEINNIAVEAWVTSRQNIAVSGRNKLGQFTRIPK